MSFIDIQDVIKRYGSKLSVDHLNLSVEQGEIFGLLGPNGAGKSTTIKMMSGLLSIDHGDIIIDRINVRRSPIEVKRLLGLVPQDIAVYDSLSARENVAFFGKLYGLRGAALNSGVNEALEFVGLAERQKDKPSTFSGGMKRRLNIACAIVHRPKLLIMDEPTVGIDPQSRNHILECVRTLNRMGSTIIYTSHYMEEVAAISHRVGIMDQGHLIASGTQEELRRQVANEEKLQIEVSELRPEALEELRQHPTVSKVQVQDTTIEIFLRNSQVFLQDILFILQKYQMSIKTLTQVEPNLETLFLSLTGRTLRDS
jgi:ABC-2 type transport system ATP-binding protein